jgi:hypothetical protein
MEVRRIIIPPTLKISTNQVNKEGEKIHAYAHLFSTLKKAMLT